jgi:DNA invertase Pin-like site-specific DNA recombinase
MSTDEKLIVGYARVSTPTQKLDRQIKNLKEAYPNIVIVQETFSAKTQNRPKWQKLLRQCKAGIVSKIVFDEVSRMSRNAEEGVKEYKELYNMGIELEFLKEPHINTSVYKQASEKKIDIVTSNMDKNTANLMDSIIGGLNEYLLNIAENQIYIAFKGAQKERDLLSMRTSEGLKTAKVLGSKVGRQKGDKVDTKKYHRCERIIRNYYLTGKLTATQTFKMCEISKSTFYRYVEKMQKEDTEKGIFWNIDKVGTPTEKDREEAINIIKYERG